MLQLLLGGKLLELLRHTSMVRKGGIAEKEEMEGGIEDGGRERWRGGKEEERGNDLCACNDARYVTHLETSAMC